ncbi:hypothetical protein D3C75_464610 [compost metagenome]
MEVSYERMLPVTGRYSGDIKSVTTLVETYVPLSSDRGSTPLGSIWSRLKDTIDGCLFCFQMK